MKTRAVMRISGDVQNVGYRITIHKAAFELDLVGHARNLEDGTVEVVIEGPKKNIERLAQNINIKRFPTKVADIGVTYSRPTGEFSQFTVIRDERFDGDLSGKLDLGLVYIQTMDEHLSSDIKTVGSHVKTMDSNMAGHFGRLDKKYDRFGRTMKGMARDIKTTRKDTKSMANGMKRMGADIKEIRKASATGRKKPTAESSTPA
jgi:acylphosphatase